MLWVLFSLLTAVTTAVANIIDKFVLSKWIRQPIGSMVTFCSVQAIAGFAAFTIHGDHRLPPKLIFLALFSGLMYALTALFYFRAVKVEEISRAIPLFDLTSLFVLPFAAIFLGETFTLPTYLGIFLLVAGALLVSTKPGQKLARGKAFWWMLAATICLAVSAVITKYLLNFEDAWTVFAYSRLGTALAGTPALFFGLPVFLSAVRRHGLPVVGAMLMSESLTVLASIFFTIGASIGYVTLVNALVGTHPFFVLLFATLLSVFFPSIIKEKISGTTLSQKIIAIILLFAGALLVTRT